MKAFFVVVLVALLSIASVSAQVDPVLRPWPASFWCMLVEHLFFFQLLIVLFIYFLKSIISSDQTIGKQFGLVGRSWRSLL